VNKEAEIAKHLKETCPFMVEENVWSRTRSDYTIYIPVEAKKGSIFEKDIIGTKHLEIVKSIQANWVEYGTRVEACVQPFLRHNVSNTVIVDDWNEVSDYLFENKQFFSGVSFLGSFGALDYKQSPFTPVIFPDEMLSKYGNGVVFASGLIVDGLHDFENDLWDACMAITNKDFVLDGTRRQVLLKKEWIRRAKQFARRHFKGDLQRMVYCLKELHLYHKWVEINRELKPMDFSKIEMKPFYTNADTLGSVGCVGGACEMPQHFLDKMKK
jgi:ribonucleoside-triphosphate reductase